VGRDLGVAEPAGDEQQHLPFARGEVVEGRRRPGARWAGGELSQQPAGDRRSQQRLAAREDPDGIDELLGRHVLEQEPARTGPDGGVDVLVAVEGREHQHAGRVRVRGVEELPGRFDPIEAGHADVHQHHVRAEPPTLGDRVRPVVGLADHLEVVLGIEDQSEPRTHQGLVVDDDHPYEAAVRPDRLVGPSRLLGGHRAAHGATSAVAASWTSSAPPSGSRARTR
jgi:hypothetical protein